MNKRSTAERLTRIVIGLMLIGTLLPGAPSQALSTPGKVFYLYYNESDEATQGYQLSSVDAANPTANPQPVFRFPADGVAPIWDEPPPAVLSPDGQSLAMIQWGAKLNSLIVIDAASGTTSTLPGISITGELDTSLLGWLPNNKQLILYKNDGELIRYDVGNKSSDVLFTLKDVLRFNAEVTLSPDGTQLIYCTSQTDNGCGGYALQGLDGSPARPVTFPAELGCPGYPAIKWSPDGQRIAVGCAKLTQIDQALLAVINVSQATTTGYTLSSPINDFVWQPNNQKLLLDLCADQDVNAADTKCGPLQNMDLASGKVTPELVAARLPARRLYWLGNTLLISEASSDTQSAALSFYDIKSGQLTRQIIHNTAEYQDASYTIVGIR